MLKNKFKMVAILIVLILALTLPIVRAENETPDTVATPDATTSEDASNEAIVPINDNPEATTSTEDDFKKSDVYLTGDNVTIDYIIDGNLFVVANHVTINSQIGGDAFICANDVTVGEQGYVYSNLFTFSKDIHIAGVVYDLYASSKNTTITGYVYRDVHIGSDSVTILGAIGRNAHISCSTLNFTATSDENSTSQGAITGNLNYSAETEASIPENAVAGETTFEQLKSIDKNVVQEKVTNLLTFIVTVIAVWLLCLWLAPNFLKKATSLLTTKKVLPVIGFGILSPIVAIFLVVIFFILGITSILGLLLFMTLFALMAISTSIFTITLNNIICDKLKIEKTIAVFGMLVATSLVLWLIGFIPVIGSILGLLIVLLGLGLVVSNLVIKEKEEITE